MTAQTFSQAFVHPAPVSNRLMTAFAILAAAMAAGSVWWIDGSRAAGLAQAGACAAGAQVSYAQVEAAAARVRLAETDWAAARPSLYAAAKAGPVPGSAEQARAEAAGAELVAARTALGELCGVQ
jgi:hypothetical protein